MIPAKFALFDPESRYSRFRASSRPGDKLRGYFHWLNAQRQAPPDPADAARRVRGAAMMFAEAAPARVGGRQLVLRLDDPDEAVGATVKPQVVADEGGAKRLELAVELHDHIPPYPVTCRAFFVEPAVLPRLASVHASLATQPPLAVLRAAFGWAGSLEVARILSGLPDLDGTVDHDGVGAFDPAPLPDSCRDINSIPDRVYIVVALDGPED